MWICENWKDYEVLDTSGGEKLERWGQYTLIRPDPQVIWNSEKTHPMWRAADAAYHRSRAGGGAWSENHLPESWVIRYGDLRFRYFCALSRNRRRAFSVFFVSGGNSCGTERDRAARV